jgi:hypothetical protein
MPKLYQSDKLLFEPAGHLSKSPQTLGHPNVFFPFSGFPVALKQVEISQKNRLINISVK